jgi:hypothetical protein
MIDSVNGRTRKWKWKKNKLFPYPVDGRAIEKKKGGI